MAAGLPRIERPPLLNDNSKLGLGFACSTLRRAYFLVRPIRQEKGTFLHRALT